MAKLTATVVVALFLGCCVVGVLTEVELGEGEELLNYHDPVQYKDCGELHSAGYNVSGPHLLYMNKTSPFLIRCEFTKYQATNVILLRQDNSVNFIQTLDVYMRGFGDTLTDYWAGLDAISHLTLSGSRVLTVYMQNARGVNKNAHYSHFQVQPNSERYQMTVAGFSGSAGLLNDLGHSTGMPFHTYDNPDTNGCAIQMRGGWWYNYCAYTLPTGYFYPPGVYTAWGKYFDGVFWQSFGGYNNSMKFFRMDVSTS